MYTNLLEIDPGCSTDEHDWQSPHSVVGGCRENPGVWGRGAGSGVVVAEVCARCGAYRYQETGARVPVEYREADDASRAWVAARARHALTEALVDVADIHPDWWCGDELHVPIDADSPATEIEAAATAAGWSVSVYSTDTVLYLERA